MTCRRDSELYLNQQKSYDASRSYNLSSSPCRYLKGVMQIGHEETIPGENPRGADISPLMPSSRREANSQAEMQASEIFVRLLCQFEPEAVLPFLQSHEAYRVQV